MGIKTMLKNVIPESWLSAFHACKAQVACWYYGNPSKDLQIIGITGTKGKSTTANFIWSVLQHNDIKTGLIGTANIRIGETEMMNPYHMTMPSPFIVQKLFAQMKSAGCKAVVMEVTSEGIKQSRHLGISFAAGIFTNLSPEHLPSHNNSYEEYARTKKIFFKTLPEDAFAVFNADDERSSYFSENTTPKKEYTSFLGKGTLNASLQEVSAEKTIFVADGFAYKIWVGGSKNAENALLAVAVGKRFGLSHQQIQKGFDALSVIPGRMEKISEGQPFEVFVDYAHEEKSMNFVVEMGNAAKKQHRLIVLLGAEGGGRDPRKRAIMGEIVGTKADFVVVSNVDPYSDDPLPIAEAIAQAAEKSGKKREENLFVVLDRREGIKKALSLASPGDIVMITGKGSEQTITIGGVATPWDDRIVVREALHHLQNS